MNEKLALLITQAKAARKTYEKALKKFDAYYLQDVEYADMVEAERALARWIVKNADKLRSVE